MSSTGPKTLPLAQSSRDDIDTRVEACPEVFEHPCYLCVRKAFQPNFHDEVTMSFKPASANVPVELDPQCDGEYVRKAFLIEGCLNFGTLPLITHPRVILSYLLNHPHHINAATVFFARLFGIIVVAALSPGLFVGARSTRNAIESRSIVYIILGGAELLLIPMLAAEALKSGGQDAVLGVKTAVTALCAIAPPLIWRIIVLFVRPDLLGRYREVKGDATERSRLTD